MTHAYELMYESTATPCTATASAAYMQHDEDPFTRMSHVTRRNRFTE